MNKCITQIFVRLDNHSAVYDSTWSIESIKSAFEYGRTVNAYNDTGSLVLLNTSQIPIFELLDLREQESQHAQA